MFTSSVLENFVQKNRTEIRTSTNLKVLNFGTKTKWNTLNSIVMFTISFLDQKYLFWANLYQEINIVC